MKLLKATVKSKVNGVSDYYISEDQYHSDAPVLTVYNGVGVEYGLLVKRENILSVSPH